METITKKPKVKVTAKAIPVDARSRIKPRGLRGMFKDSLIVIGKDEEVFGLTLTTNVG